MLRRCVGCGRTFPAVDEGRFDCPCCGLITATSMTLVPDPPGTVIMEIGRNGNLNPQLARQVATTMINDLAAVPATVPILITLGGFDDDPREIVDIPEARTYLLAWAEMITRHGIAPERFLQESRHLIAACYLVATGKRHLVNFTARDSTELQEQIAQFHRDVT